MKIHEYLAREIFQKADIPIMVGRVASDVADAAVIAEEQGYPVVLKSQVLVGGRGKAGGIRIVNNKEELENNFAELEKLTIKGYPVKKIFVVRAADIVKEYYVGVIVDSAKGDVVIIASSEGGVEIEETAKTNPDAIKKLYLNGNSKLDKDALQSYVEEIFQEPQLQDEAKLILQKLVNVFFALDCSIAEINPLILTGKGHLEALDAKINFDDNALGRHPELEELRDMDYEDPEELEAKEKNLSFVKLEGDVGCIVNGAGLAMGTMDIVKLSGGKPANFLDVGGSSNPEKVLNALNIILKNPDLKAILINIFGGITRCDDIANGIIQARAKIDLPVPMVVRLTGTNENEAKQILSDNDIETFSTMREAVDKVVQLTK